MQSQLKLGVYPERVRSMVEPPMLPDEMSQARAERLARKRLSRRASEARERRRRTVQVIY